MRLIIPFASAFSALRGQLSRSMSSSDHSIGDGSIRNFLREVYQKSHPRNVFSVFVTGGGSTALEWLFTVPGASNCLMDAGVVYSRPALRAFMRGCTNQQPISTCSSLVALTMADTSWRHANEFLLADSCDFNSLRDAKIFGVSCTASLVSDVPKRGAHRVYVATTMQAVSRVYTVEFEKGLRNRVEEDAACSRLLLDAIAQCCSIAPLPTDYLFDAAGEVNPRKKSTEIVLTTTVQRTDVLARILGRETRQAIFIKSAFTEKAIGTTMTSTLLTVSDNVDVDETTTSTLLVESGNVDTDEITQKGEASATETGQLQDNFVILEDVPLPKGTILFPGSFNPLHEGHVALVVAALRKVSESLPSRLGDLILNRHSDSGSDSTGSHDHGDVDDWKRIPVIFEVAAINADKPPLPRTEVLRRVEQFDPFLNTVLTSANLTNIAVCVTSEPLFLEKSKLFPGCNFLIGSDTMSRIINPKYYGPLLHLPEGLTPAEISLEVERHRQQSVYTMVAALSTIAERGCHFIVGGRVTSPSSLEAVEKKFDTFESVCSKSSVDIPPSLLNSLFSGLSEDEFRLDLSSTQLREN